MATTQHQQPSHTTARDRSIKPDRLSTTSLGNSC